MKTYIITFNLGCFFKDNAILYRTYTAVMNEAQIADYLAANDSAWIKYRSNPKTGELC